MKKIVEILELVIDKEYWMSMVEKVDLETILEVLSIYRGVNTAFKLAKTIENAYAYIGDNRKSARWHKAIQDTCNLTEGIDSNFGEYLERKNSVKRIYNNLIQGKNLEDVYSEFIIVMAVELCAIDEERKKAISFAIAILDQWFKGNKKVGEGLKENLELSKIKETIYNREALYSAYFKLFEDKYGSDRVKVYFPKNGEDWIRRDDNYSITVNLNLSKGVDLGFCKTGFDYSIVGEEERMLKTAYEDKGREVMRFDTYQFDKGRMLWAR